MARGGRGSRVAASRRGGARGARGAGGRPRGRPRGSSLAIWECPFCLSEFSSRRDLAQHKRTHSQEERGTVKKSDKPKCQICNRLFDNFADLARHGRTSGHGFSRFKCPFCHKKFGNRIELRDHQSQHYEHSGYTVVASAFSNAVEVVEKVFPNPETAPANIDSLFAMEGDNMYNIIKSYIFRLHFISLYIVFTARFSKTDAEGNTLETLMLPLRS